MQQRMRLPSCFLRLLARKKSAIISAAFVRVLYSLLPDADVDSFAMWFREVPSLIA